MGNLKQDSRSVTRFSISPFSSAMTKVFEDLQGVVNEFVAFVSVDIHYHTHPTSVVLMGGIVQSISHLLLHLNRILVIFLSNYLQNYKKTFRLKYEISKMYL